MLTCRRRAFGAELLPAVLMVISAALTTSCTDNPEDNSPRPQSAPEHAAVAARADDGGGQEFDRQRAEMVAQQLAARDITERQVLKAMGRVPRHEFVPAPMRPLAYADSPLPIGHGQTISQPYIVALMTQLAAPRPAHKALDIGTGSGYQAAVLAELVHDVYSIEIVEPLANEARQRLQSLGYKNIHVRCGDGYRGWPDEAPFDIIIVAAAPDHVPEPLVEQLAPGGQNGHSRRRPVAGPTRRGEG